MVASHGVSQSGLRRRTSAQARRVADRSGRSPTRPCARGRPARRSRERGSVVAAADLVDRVPRIGAEHGEPVLHAARRAGQVHHERAPATPASPRESAAVGTPCRAVRADRLGDAGHLEVEQRPGHLGGAVGRRDAGAASGERRRGPRRRRRPAAPRRPAHRRVRRPGPSTSKPSRAARRRSAARWCPRRPRPRPGSTRTITRAPTHGRAQTPVLPPSSTGRGRR